MYGGWTEYLVLWTNLKGFIWDQLNWTLFSILMLTILMFLTIHSDINLIVNFLKYKRFALLEKKWMFR